MHVHLTSNIEWNPHDVALSQIQTTHVHASNHDDSITHLLPDMHALLAKHQVISETDSSLVSPRQSFVSNDRHQQITVHRLAENLGVAHNVLMQPCGQQLKEVYAQLSYQSLDVIGLTDFSRHEPLMVNLPLTLCG